MSKATDKRPVAPLQPARAANAEPIVTIDSEVTRRIRQHARSHSTTEVCGVLIGESTDDAIDIRASIEALNAAQAGTHVTFTQDAWEEIYKVKDEQYPDARIVGWYHSHPGFGIFLSEHDLFIQENFFSSPGQVAWVYDPHSDDEGCFGWVSGKVARLTSVSTLYQSGEPVEHAANNNAASAAASTEQDDEISASLAQSSPKHLAPAWVRWSKTALTHLVLLLAGFALAYFLFPRMLAVIPDPPSGQVMVVDYRQLHAYLTGTGPAPKPLDVMNLPPLPSAAPSTIPTPAQSLPATPAPTKPDANAPGGKK